MLGYKINISSSDPETVWFTILSQLNIYFSSHQDDSQVQSNIQYRKNINFDIKGYRNRDDEEETLPRYNIVDIVDGETRDRFKVPETRAWLHTNSSTTKGYEDAIVANLVLTGPINSYSAGYTTNSSYLSSATSVPYGIPSITLLGRQADWSLLLQKLERLPCSGLQPAEYAKMLRPILTRFVKSFDYPQDRDIRKFWDMIVRVHSLKGEGTTCLSENMVSGWINGFYYWDAGGFVLSDSTSLSLETVEYPIRDTHKLPSIYTNTPLHERKSAMGYVYIRLGELAVYLFRRPTSFIVCCSLFRDGF
jgi:hypothetical protein